MVKADPRVDAYIANAAPFARPILKYLREIVHATCPDGVETIKWRMPFFDYGGSLCHFAAFKQHCALGFWKGKLLVQGDDRSEEAMGQFGRISSVDDLPSRKVLAGYIKQAMRLNESGAKSDKPKSAPRAAPQAPDDLLAALGKNKKARATFEAFSPSCKREYVDWIAEAKRAETRAKRVTEAVAWMAEGKQRNWKYMDC